MAEIKGSYVAGTGTITANTNIAFKLGTQAKLEALAKEKVQNGVFYLTSDTHRLYIGNADGSISPVNQGVIPVANLASVTNPIPGQFYYLTSDNILATHNGTQWVQINPDTYVKGLWDTVSATDDGVKIITNLEQAGGVHQGIIESDDTEDSIPVHIDGGQKIKVSAGSGTSANHITIATGDYGFVTDGSDNNVNVNLTYTAPGATEVTKEEKVNIKSVNGIKVTQANNTLTFDGSELKNQAGADKIVDAEFTAEASGFMLTLTKGNNDAITATVNPKIKYGKANYGDGQHEHEFVSGVDTLHVYTIDQVDKLVADSLTNFNALTYKGTVGATGATVNALPQSGVANGDVYMGDGSVAVKLTANGTAELYDAGTLFIAQGTEGIDGVIPANTVTWTRVQNYNTDTITTVDTGTAGTITIGREIVGGVNHGSVETLGSLTITADGVLKAEDSIDGTHRTTTIRHKTYEVKSSDPEIRAADSAKYLYIGKQIESLDHDAYGHLQFINEQEVVVPTEVFCKDECVNTVSVDEPTNVATLSQTISLMNSSNEGPVDDITQNHKVTSETLVLKATEANTLKLDLVWGSFE